MSSRGRLYPNSRLVGVVSRHDGSVRLGARINALLSPSLVGLNNLLFAKFSIYVISTRCGWLGGSALSFFTLS